jgi:RimJ/RimL family protein N-acetyltransferase
VNEVIRPWKAGDLAALVENANSLAVWQNLRDAFPHPYTKRDGRAWLSCVLGEDPPHSFAIQVDGQAVGAIGLHAGQDVERVSAEVGYWVGERYWGRGLATAAVVALTSEAFRTRPLNRLFALPFARNAPSLRVLEKAGYRREGLLRGSAEKEGQLLDQLLFAVTREEWKR